MPHGDLNSKSHHCTVKNNKLSWYIFLGSTPLFYATKFPTAFNRLIDAGADVYATTYTGENIFHKLNSTSSEMLKRFPALVNQKSCAGSLIIKGW